MSDLAGALWERAKKALAVAHLDLPMDADAAASRAYFAAFYAVCAHFARQGKTFRKHSAVESAVHRDLVKPGLWPKELGAKFSALAELRTVGDYGDYEHVPSEEGANAVRIAGEIVEAVRSANSDTFQA